MICVREIYTRGLGTSLSSSTSLPIQCKIILFIWERHKNHIRHQEDCVTHSNLARRSYTSSIRSLGCGSYKLYLMVKPMALSANLTISITYHQCYVIVINPSTSKRIFSIRKPTSFNTNMTIITQTPASSSIICLSLNRAHKETNVPTLTPVETTTIGL